MSYFNSIPLRKSTRRYSVDTISQDIIDDVLKVSNDFIKLVPLKDVSIIPITDSVIHERFKAAFGDYGKLLNASVYFALTTERNYGEKPVNLGFIGEQLAIELTSRGIATSWLAVFDEQAFKGAFETGNGHVVHCFISAGYASAGMQDKFINKLMGKTSNKRKKLKKIIFKDNVKTKAGKSFLKQKGLLEVFEMARLAPSWHNTQPWYFILNDNKIYLIMDFDEARYKLKVVHEKFFYNSISMGVIMSHIAMCAQEKGIKGKWSILPKQRGISMREDFAIKPQNGIPFAEFEMEM